MTRWRRHALFGLVTTFFLVIYGAGISAVSADEQTIDSTRTGSITLYKMCSEDGKTISGTGYVQAEEQENTILLRDESGEVVTDKPLAGVSFGCLKVGELEQIAEAGGKIGLYYTLSGEFIQVLETQTRGILSGKDRNGDGINEYTAENLNQALACVCRTRSKTGTGETALTELVAQSGQAFEKTDVKGKTSLAGLELGLYLVAETEWPADQADGKTPAIASPASPFLISLPMTNITKIEGDRSGTIWQYDVTAYPKNSVLMIAKEIVADGNDLADDSDGDGLVRTTDKNVGDVLTEVIRTEVPVLIQDPESEGGTAERKKIEKYAVTDSLSKGLTFREEDKAALIVSLGTDQWNGANAILQKDRDYAVTVDETNNSFTVCMLEEGLKKLNETTEDSAVYVKYTALINRAAAEVTGGIKESSNSAYLRFQTDRTDVQTFATNIPKIYTYELDVKKLFSSSTEETKAYRAVNFTLDAGEKELLFVREKDGIYHLTDGTGEDLANAVREVTPAADSGELILKGLDADTYILTETATISGYSLMKDPLSVTLGKSFPEDGSLDSAEVFTISSPDKAVELTEGLEKGYAVLTIKNNEGITWLRTGGGGWYVFGVAGAALLAAAFFLIRAIWKKKQEK